MTENPVQPDCIEFKGDFESGNLDYAIKIEDD